MHANNIYRCQISHLSPNYISLALSCKDSNLQANWGEWNLPYSVCDFYLAMDVMCSTSSIFHLVAISVDRFFAVTSPILYSQHRHNTTPAFTVILACWATSLAIGLPIMCGLNHRPETEAGGGWNISEPLNSRNEIIKTDI